MLLEEMLHELGYELAALSTHLDEALALARTAAFDVALLDINLNGQQSFPVADAIRARGLPFLFATGYGSRILADSKRPKSAGHGRKPAGGHRFWLSARAICSCRALNTRVAAWASCCVISPFIIAAARAACSVSRLRIPAPPVGGSSSIGRLRRTGQTRCSTISAARR